MILRKPYAFLIKHFKIIHLILTILTIYILIKIGSISDFFSSYVSNNYSAIIPPNISEIYIQNILYFLISIMILILIAIIYLLLHKKKKQKIYYFAFINNILLLIFLIYFTSVFNSLELGVVSADLARFYRDVTLIMYLPQYIFVVFFGIRALGFNIKQFNFSSDLESLKLNSNDNEEVEINIEFDAYKAKRGFRKFRREFKYYIKENLIMIILVLLIATIWGGYSIYRNSELFNSNNYSENQSFYHNELTLNVMESFITQTDLGGKKVLDDKYFLVIQLEIQNPTEKDIKVDPNHLNLSYNDIQITPEISYGKNFSDYGKNFPLTNIKANSKNIYVIPYILEESEIKNDFELRLYTGNYNDDNKVYSTYDIVNLDTYMQSSETTIDTLELNSDLNFLDTNIKNSSILIEYYELSTSFYYQAEKCYNEDNCVIYNDFIVLDYTSGDSDKLFMVINNDLKLDNSSIYFSNNPLTADFFNNFVEIEYNYNGNDIKEAVISVDLENLNNELVLKVPKDVETSD